MESGNNWSPALNLSQELGDYFTLKMGIARSTSADAVPDQRQLPAVQQSAGCRQRYQKRLLPAGQRRSEGGRPASTKRSGRSSIMTAGWPA
ncbi:hypothetical protein M8494_35905 [Serratia ureilytica]